MGVPYVKLASAVSVAAVVGAVVFNSPANAAPTAFTWTGAAGDHKMSTAGNWKDGQVPTEGSKLVFTCANGASETIQNDLNVALSGLDAQKMNNVTGGPTCASYTIDTLKFTPDAEFSGGHTSAADEEGKIPNIYVTGAVTGLSNLKSNGFDGKFTSRPTINRFEVANSGCNNISYYINAPEKVVGENASVPLEGANNITVKSGGQLGVKYADNETSTSKITFENGAMISHGISCLGSGGGSSNVTTVLSGDIVLNGNVEYKLLSNVTVKITGKLSGSGKLVAHKDNKGTLLVESSDNTSGTPNGQHGNAHEAKLIKLDGDKPNEPVNVKKGETVLLNGSRSDVYVDEGGVFGGNATVKSLSVAGVVAPGNSPGKITVLNDFYMNGTGVYKAEILDKDHYDQIVAQSVQLSNGGNSSKLELVYLPGGTIKKGDTFTIINNNSSAPVQGTFNGLPEGAEFAVDGATFKMSYVGGDGNDVVLTAQNDSKGPKAPNTGGENVAVNLAGTIVGVASAAILLFMAKRKSFGKK